MRRALRAVVRVYLNGIERRPLLTKCLITGSLFGFGDACAQNLENAHWIGGRTDSCHTDGRDTKRKFNWWRLIRFTAFGALIAGPGFHYWYSVGLERLTRRCIKPNASHWWQVGFKLLADELVAGPIFYVMFFGILGLAEGKSLSEISAKLRAEYVSTVLTDVKVWTPIQILNFRFVPIQHQPLVVTLVSLGWNTFLSAVEHRSVRSSDSDTAALSTLSHDTKPAVGMSLPLVRSAKADSIDMALPTSRMSTTEDEQRRGIAVILDTPENTSDISSVRSEHARVTTPVRT